MDVCESSCRDAASIFVKQTFFDILLRRTIEEKIDNYCHIDCIRRLRIQNFKKNGRWGFIMIFGFTEICSSFLAFANSMFTIYYFNKIIFPKIHRTPLRKLIHMQYYICNIAFISSTLFHMRETTFTRYADYLSAYLSIVVGLICGLGRVIHCVAPYMLDKYIHYSTLIGFLSFAIHLYRMVFIKWDYVYNKFICGFMFACSCLCDLGLYFYVREMESSKHILYYIAGLFVAGIAEVSDISPVLFLFDSHAFWHLCMTISSIFYYYFISGHIDFFSKLKKLH